MNRNRHSSTHVSVFRCGHGGGVVSVVHADEAAVVAKDGVEEAAGEEVELAAGGPRALRGGTEDVVGKLFRVGNEV